MNKVILKGRFVKDPDFKTISDTNSVANFVIANNTGFGDNEKTNFIDCSAYGKKAEAISKFFNKGRNILIEGEILQDKWQDKETNENRSKLYVRVLDFDFIDSQKTEDTPDKKEAPRTQKGKEKSPF